MALSTCAIDFIKSNQPCAQCLSERELLAVLALLVGLLNDSRTNADTILSNAPCWACFDDKRMLENLVKIFHELAYDAGVISENVSGLRAEAACLICADPKLVRAAIIHELCEYLGATQPPT